MRWTEFGYSHNRQPWRRRVYTLPLASDEALIMNAGAREAVAARLFARATQIATTFAPTQ